MQRARLPSPPAGDGLPDAAYAWPAARSAHEAALEQLRVRVATRRLQHGEARLAHAIAPDDHTGPRVLATVRHLRGAIQELRQAEQSGDAPRVWEAVLARERDALARRDVGRRRSG